MARSALETVTSVVPDSPPLVAVIVTEPSRTPVTNPDKFTVATSSSDEDQVKAADGIAAPPPSVAAAESCRVSPMTTPPSSGVTATAETAC